MGAEQALPIDAARGGRVGGQERRSDLRSAGRRRADDVAPLLLAALPHEIRRSLGVISILGDGLDDADGARSALTQELSRIARLIDSVGEAARRIGSAGAATGASLDPVDAMRSALAAFSGDPDGCEVGQAFPTDLPFVRGDAELVVSVLLNLLSNASRHGAAPVTIGASRAGDRVDLTVSDAGPGLPAAGGARPWRRVNTGARASSGVGLAISRLFADEMGGELVVDSVPGRCRVSLRLMEAHS